MNVIYTSASMNMEKLRWLVAGKDVDLNTIPGNTASSPWELLTARPDWITEDTVVFLKFTFDKNIDLETFKDNYNKATPEDKKKLLMLTSDMFEMTDVAFGNGNTMTIKCNWNKETDPNPDPTITLKGNGLPVKNDWNGSKQIDITNSGCVSGTVHIKYENSGPEEAAARAETVVPYVAANVQGQNTPPLDSDNTIRIPIVGGRADDKFTLYYGGGSSGDSSGGSRASTTAQMTTTGV